MRMIPASPYPTSSNAEKKVFDFLRRCYGNDSRFVAFHSLNLTSHSKKRFGEVDFLICCSLGIYVLEVKGGRVDCQNGEWSFTNKAGDSGRNREGPFVQANTALHAILSNLKQHLPVSLVNDFVPGYGVVLTDCKLDVVGAEWDNETLCDGGRHRNFESWLNKLFRYWRAKDLDVRGKDRKASNDKINELVAFLRPNFESIVPLYIQTDSAHERIVSLTESQMMLVDCMELNQRVLSEGGAGTGKTFVGLELARRWAGEGLQVALVCHSPWLKNFLEANHSVSNLTICTLNGLQQQMRRKGVEKFDALIVDEGQDLLTLECLAQLDQALLGELENGKWCFFVDINNQSGFFQNVEEEAIAYLRGIDHFTVPLNRNCRNTSVILNHIKESLGADLGIEGAGDGPEVRDFCVESVTLACSAIARELKGIINNGGIAVENVTILSDRSTISEVYAELKKTSRFSFQMIDEFSVRNFPPAAISLANIADFKGLENDVILFVSTSSSLCANRTLSYTAMSRAKVLLSITHVVSQIESSV